MESATAMAMYASTTRVLSAMGLIRKAKSVRRVEARALSCPPIMAGLPDAVVGLAYWRPVRLRGRDRACGGSLRDGGEEREVMRTIMLVAWHAVELAAFVSSPWLAWRLLTDPWGERS